MAKGEGQQRERRHFTAEFKVEAVRRVWARQAAERDGHAPADVFPGHGRLPAEEEELRRLKRRNARLQQENAFLKGAAAYFARESR